MEEFLKTWGYLGIFVGIIATGLGLPMPEELPVVIAGGLVHDTNPLDYRWWLMLLTCIVGVVVGDSCLYMIGRFWGRRLVSHAFVRKRLLPPERLLAITDNFDKYGVKILLFARLTPGIRAPIFVTAGITKLPWAKFLLADGIYAVPGVTILFGLGYWFTDSMVDLIKQEAGLVKPIIIVVVILAVVSYFVYRHLRRPVVEGSPREMPPVVGRVTNTLDHTIETVREILHTSHPPGDPAPPPGRGEAGRQEPPANPRPENPSAGPVPDAALPAAHHETEQPSHSPGPHQSADPPTADSKGEGRLATGENGQLLHLDKSDPRVSQSDKRPEIEK